MHLCSYDFSVIFHFITKLLHYVVKEIMFSYMSIPQIYIFYSWMWHWPITEKRKMSQSSSGNRSKIHVYFLS